jgi:hypothetical protein
MAAPPLSACRIEVICTSSRERPGGGGWGRPGPGRGLTWRLRPARSMSAVRVPSGTHVVSVRVRVGGPCRKLPAQPGRLGPSERRKWRPDPGRAAPDAAGRSAHAALNVSTRERQGAHAALASRNRKRQARSPFAPALTTDKSTPAAFIAPSEIRQKPNDFNGYGGDEFRHNTVRRRPPTSATAL